MAQCTAPHHKRSAPWFNLLQGFAPSGHPATGSPQCPHRDIQFDGVLTRGSEVHAQVEKRLCGSTRDFVALQPRRHKFGAHPCIDMSCGFTKIGVP